MTTTHDSLYGYLDLDQQDEFDWLVEKIEELETLRDSEVPYVESMLAVFDVLSDAPPYEGSVLVSEVRDRLALLHDTIRLLPAMVERMQQLDGQIRRELDLSGEPDR